MNTAWKRLAIFASFVVLFCSPVPARAADLDDSGLKAVSAWGPSQLYESGKLSVAVLNGNYRQMGRQYGLLLRAKMRRLYDVAITGEYIGRQGFTYNRLKALSRSVFDLYPERYKEIIYGMAETSGLGLEKQLMLNAIELYPMLEHFVPHCSGFAVWGDYTAGKPLIFGRNNDATPDQRQFAEFMTVAVFNPTDRSIPTAIVNFAGVVYAPTGINKKGIFLELNSGNWMGYFTDRLAFPVTLLSYLQDFATLDALGAALNSTRPNLSAIVTIADKNTAYSYEMSPEAVKHRSPDEEGMLAATNHFVDPSWGLPPPDDAANGWTVTRRTNLLTLGEALKGRFTAMKMQEVMETLIDDGGPAFPDSTIYQVVAVPGELKLWVRAPGHFAWKEIDLKYLFR